MKNPADPVKAIKELLGEIKELKQQIEEVEIGKAANIKSTLLKGVENVNGIKFISSEVEITDQKVLKQLIFQMGQELGDQSFLLLGSRGDEKAQLMLYVSESLVKSKNLNAGTIIKQLAKSINGGGGGQPFLLRRGTTLVAYKQRWTKPDRSLNNKHFSFRLHHDLMSSCRGGVES